jgi:predicted RNA binding protein YcfA (HicA-like mRNA interferase family)
MSVYEMCILEMEGSAPMNSREIIRKLQFDGWFEVAQAGSHKQFKHPMKPGRVTVPYPKKDVPKGTLKSIEKQGRLKLT